MESAWVNALTSPSDVKELTPEFFAGPSIFLRNAAGLPLGTTQGGVAVGDVALPMNVNFMGRRFGEARLLTIAHGFEQTTNARMEPRYAKTMDVEAALRHPSPEQCDSSSP